MTTTKLQAIVLRDFTDDGTGESFTASSDAVPIEEGAFINYKAAGLLEAAPAAEAEKPAPDKPGKNEKPVGDKPA